jgi:hypothetical protein
MFFERLNAAGEVVGYIYINPDKGTTPLRSGRCSFRDTVEFDMEKTKRGQEEGPASGYPVVFDDYTVMPPYTLNEIEFTNIPAVVKAKYTRWEKYQ